MPNRLKFDTAENATFGRLITPCIDGRLLSDRVSEFETQQGFDLAGRYVGLPPGGYRYGPFDQYFLGLTFRFDDLGGIHVLACRYCGFVGCWPLLCKVSIVAREVHWSDFRQPHRKKWDYSGFGPFVFERAAFDAAVHTLVADLGAGTGTL
ncbi:MAG TPA: hypothetical protein VHZ78_00585 [Rhizomicrobium sp.]|jgi:hypothetical protein|nr:hypothetical protein [Rhizomicrobium sp.]